ncbi:PKD domain-containing protein [Arcticibacter tournemirensis]|uniref:PKD domain-containing protein n=1 Tax=Arcticibacter tournemirensis TaxID=699437 RepID=A0A4Q0M709_9SPHI|nr:PKD domain-containing protein [Arcticibacter tournemirensis]KAA8483077.1 PKD domain-containing protein [Arcticibacter tournemirensis]RXF68785.1 PKD domain-containing protein [Arcticibacter tournemirensis]TQM52010.1 PKD domain-containing protein [Arcticibacter tournemirensis]
MKTFKLMRYILPLVLLAWVLNGCKDEDNEPVVDVIYTLDVEGNQVAFKNETKGVSAYKWEFGDGTNSEEESPVHTYPGKGKYVATLYATTASGQTVEGSTVIRISKSTPVKLKDNTLSDWDNITANVITPTAAGNGIKKVKLDYDGNAVYVYIEVSGNRSDTPVFDFYIDSDNNAGTGYLTGTYPEGGYDILMEGQILEGAFDVFYHYDPQTAFNFDPQSISEAYAVGTVVEENGLLKFECSLQRSKLKFLTGTGLRIAIAAVKSDWSASIGSAPDEGSAGYFLNMDE